ncbi:MAG: Hpt domain-containing response regulator [Lysobacterales bacterium]
MNDVTYCAGLRILVVDDHLVSRRYTVRALRQIGAAVKAADTAERALAVALRWRPDAVVTDIHLPGVDGFALLRLIRRDWPRSQPAPRMIVLSADPAARWQAAASADAILVKPATPAQLRAALCPAGQRSGNSGVSETGDGARATAVTEDELQALFRQELAAQLPALEASLAARDLRRARGIAHQLLASSRLCGERRLELSLQAFHAACREGARAGAVARGYYGLLAGADQYLGFVLRQRESTAASPEQLGPVRRKSPEQ